MSVHAALPLVSGRTRNRALARHARAIQLANGGRTYQEIADELGYPNSGTVHHIVHDALARDRKAAVQNHQPGSSADTCGANRVQRPSTCRGVGPSGAFWGLPD